MAGLPAGGEARGKAGVFGSSINPLSVYMQYSAQRQRNRAALEAQQRAERDKAMDYLDKFNPSSKFEIFNRDVNDQAKGVREWYIQQKELGRGDLELMPELKHKQGQVLSYAEEADGWKKIIDDLETKVNNDPIRYKVEGPDTLKSLLRNIYLNADGSKKQDINEIREGFNNADRLLYDPRVINEDGAIKLWTEKLPEQSRVLLTKAYSAMGYSPDQIENIVKSGLTYEMEPDPQTGEMRPALDDDLMPKVVVDEKLYRLAKADPWVNSLMMSAAKDKEGQMAWLKKKVKGQGDKVSVERQVISGKKLDTDNDPRNMAFGINFGFDVSRIESRRDWLEKATSGNRADLLKGIGNITKDIKANYSPDKKKIIIEFPSGLEDPNLINNPNLAGILISPGKAKGTYELDISTPQAQRAARIALSEIVDSQLRDSKQAIGTDNYVRYEEAYSKSKQKGASGVKWK